MHIYLTNIPYILQRLHILTVQDCGALQTAKSSSSLCCIIQSTTSYTTRVSKLSFHKQSAGQLTDLQVSYTEFDHVQWSCSNVGTCAQSIRACFWNNNKTILFMYFEYLLELWMRAVEQEIKGLKKDSRGTEQEAWGMFHFAKCLSSGSV